MTSHNKGKKYRLCKECNRKRYCTRVFAGRIDGYDYDTITCSQGHFWKIQVGPLDRIVREEMTRVIPQLKDIFNRDDPFLEYLTRRK